MWLLGCRVDWTQWILFQVTGCLMLQGMITRHATGQCAARVRVRKGRYKLESLWKAWWPQNQKLKNGSWGETEETKCISGRRARFVLHVIFWQIINSMFNINAPILNILASFWLQNVLSQSIPVINKGMHPWGIFFLSFSFQLCSYLAILMLIQKSTGIEECFSFE